MALKRRIITEIMGFFEGSGEIIPLDVKRHLVNGFHRMNLWGLTDLKILLDGLPKVFYLKCPVCGVRLARHKKNEKTVFICKCCGKEWT